MPSAQYWQRLTKRISLRTKIISACSSSLSRPQSTRLVSSDATLLLVVNSHHDVVLFTLPEIAGANRWYCLLDTNDPDRGEPPDFSSHDRYQVTGRSLVLFALEAHGETGRVLHRLAIDLTGDKGNRRH